jgi:hypothetical protein
MVAAIASFLTALLVTSDALGSVVCAMGLLTLTNLVCGLLHERGHLRAAKRIDASRSYTLKIGTGRWRLCTCGGTNVLIGPPRLPNFGFSVDAGLATSDPYLLRLIVRAGPRTDFAVVLATLATFAVAAAAGVWMPNARSLAIATLTPFGVALHMFSVNSVSAKWARGSDGYWLTQLQSRPRAAARLLHLVEAGHWRTKG